MRNSIARAIRASALTFALLGGLSSALLGQADGLSPALRKAEDAARTRAATDLVKLARYSARAKSFDEARVDLLRALAISPDHKAAKKELARIAKKKSSPRKGFPKAVKAKRKSTYRGCAKRLGTAAKKLHKAGHPTRYDTLARLVVMQFGAKEARAFGAVWYDPFRTWVHPTDAKRLKTGAIRFDGKWLTRKEQQKPNAEHRTWDNPWVLDDGVHELRTTLSLREAKHLLGHIGAFRTFLLGSFAGEWDLRPPKGLLPVIVTETQADMQEQVQKAMRAAGGGQAQGPRQGAAFYMQSNRELNPCFVTLEPNTANAGPRAVKVDEIYIPLQHEVTHQIAFEFSKYDYTRTRGIENQFWCVEALANLFEYYVIEKGTWRLARPRQIPMGGGYAEGGFAYTKSHLGSLPTLEALFALSQQRFTTVENYHMSSLVAHFLLSGETGRYRRSFIELLGIIHRVKDDGETFDTCFKGVDRAAMQKAWEDFARSIEIDR